MQTVGRTATYLAFVAQGLLAASFVVLFGFYSSLQGDRTVRWLLLLLPVAKREEARMRLLRSQRNWVLIFAGNVWCAWPSPAWLRWRTPLGTSLRIGFRCR